MILPSLPLVTEMHLSVLMFVGDVTSACISSFPHSDNCEYGLFILASCTAVIGTALRVLVLGYTCAVLYIINDNIILYNVIFIK